MTETVKDFIRRNRAAGHVAVQCVECYSIVGLSVSRLLAHRKKYHPDLQSHNGLYVVKQ